MNGGKGKVADALDVAGNLIKEGARSGGMGFYTLLLAAAFLVATLMIMDSVIELYETELKHKNELLGSFAQQMMDNTPTRLDVAEREKFKRLMESMNRRLNRIENKLEIQAQPKKSSLESNFA